MNNAHVPTIDLDTLRHERRLAEVAIPDPGEVAVMTEAKVTCLECGRELRNVVAVMNRHPMTLPLDYNDQGEPRSMTLAIVRVGFPRCCKRDLYRIEAQTMEVR